VLVKIVISASGEGLGARVDPRFGRAAGFVLFDTQTREAKAVDNHQSLSAVQGAGLQAAETVARLGAECLITGHCGPKAYRALQTAGIKVYTGATGTVGEAITALEQGRLKLSEGADVEGHW
jgi:predicted Fe-Mo cluster-binding NifX family protein